MSIIHAAILGTGHAYPSGILTNADLEKMVDTSDDWITTRTGIKQRRKAAPGEYTSQFASQASREAIERAGIDPTEIGIVREALPKFKYKPLSHLPYLKRAQVENYWMDEISETVAATTSAVFVAKVSERIVGFAVYADSPWDTRVIGRRIGSLKHLAADAVLPACKRNLHVPIGQLRVTRHRDVCNDLRRADEGGLVGFHMPRIRDAV